MARYCWPFLLGLSLAVKVKVDPMVSWKVPPFLGSVMPVQSRMGVEVPDEAVDAAGAEEEAEPVAAVEVEFVEPAPAVPAVSMVPINTTDAPCIWGEKFKLPTLVKSM